MIRRFKSLCLVLIALLVFAGMNSPITLHAQNNESSAQVYTVAWGDTLFSIAVRYGVTVNDILAANNLAQADLISAGQQLLIPGSAGIASAPASTSTQHTVQAGENLFRISIQYGVSLDDLMALNNLGDPGQLFVGQVLTIGGSSPAVSSPPPTVAAPPTGSTHVVQAGETLFGIATQHGVSVTSLVNTNNLLNASTIYTGQVLTLPGAATANTPGYTPAGTSQTYTVAVGDTLSSISIAYNTSVAILSQINQITNPATLHVGQVLTLPDSAALTPANPASSPKSIVVDVSDQRTYLYENGILITSYLSSTGQPGSDTYRGTYAIQNKIPNAYAATWNLQMPHWLGFYWAGPLQNGFHALPILSNGVRLWEGYLGTPISYGCVVLGTDDAEQLYNWAEVGVPVVVQD